VDDREAVVATTLDQVLAVVKPDNHQSQAVCRRLGMEHVGLTDRYYGMPLELLRTGARRPSLRHWSR
jgi:RimJ/RimL family protein N-acetyltransferase